MAAMMCFGGGVLLSTVFIHMLPEVRDNLVKVTFVDYPFAELTLCAGFFTIYLIEALVHRLFRIQTHSHGLPPELMTQEQEGHGHSHGENGIDR